MLYPAESQLTPDASEVTLCLLDIGYEFCEANTTVMNIKIFQPLSRCLAAVTARTHVVAVATQHYTPDYPIRDIKAN